MRGNDTRLKQPSQPRALKHTERAYLNDPYALMPPRGARATGVSRAGGRWHGRALLHARMTSHVGAILWQACVRTACVQFNCVGRAPLRLLLGEGNIRAACQVETIRRALPLHALMGASA